MFNFEIQGYFIDLDGTLLDISHYKMSTLNSETITNVNKNIPITISTGRAANDFIYEIMKIHNIKYAICQNGAIIVDKDRNILKNIIIPSKNVEIIINAIIKFKLFFLINSKGLFYGPKTWHWILGLFSKWKAVPYKIYNEENNEEINKILIVSLNKPKLNKFINYLKNLNIDINFTLTGKGWAIEITDINASKGLGNVFVSELLEIDPKKTVHIGDSMNDSTVLGKVGALVALSNATKELKKIATHIGPYYKKNGVAKVLLGDIRKNDKKI